MVRPNEVRAMMDSGYVKHDNYRIKQNNYERDNRESNRVERDNAKIERDNHIALMPDYMLLMFNESTERIL